MEIAQLKAFVAVAQSGGFALAAATLDVVPSSVTRAIANLEQSLGVRLFQRTTRSVTLTEAGDRFLERILPALEEIEGAVENLTDADALVSGNLRIAASVSFGQVVLAPKLKQFADQYPDTTIELILSDTVTDLITERVDVAVRHGTLTDSSLVARRLRDVQYRLVASPDYLNSAEKITRPGDLVYHPCLTFPYPSFRSSWLFTKPGKSQQVDIEPTMRISNATALSACVKSAMGLSLLADWMVDQDISDGKLFNVLPGWTASGVDDNPDSALWVVTPTRQFVPAKTKAFVDFLYKQMS